MNELSPMNDRERLIELLRIFFLQCGDNAAHPAKRINTLAKFLIAHGVTFERHGRWDDSGRYKFLNEGCIAIRCSECGCCLHEDEYRSYNWNYCPYCGAKMDKEEKCAE